MEDSQARAEMKMRRAVEEVKKLLVPAVSTCPTHTSSFAHITHTMVAAYGLISHLMVFTSNAIWVSKEDNTKDITEL